MIRQACLLVVPVAFLAACAGERAERPGPLGSERDLHGCIPSAGYMWCQRTGQCERPWELGRTQGFPPSQEAFENYCQNPPR